MYVCYELILYIQKCVYIYIYMFRDVTWGKHVCTYIYIYIYTHFFSLRLFNSLSSALVFLLGERDQTDGFLGVILLRMEVTLMPVRTWGWFWLRRQKSWGTFTFPCFRVVNFYPKKPAFQLAPGSEQSLLTIGRFLAWCPGEESWDDDEPFS